MTIEKARDVLADFDTDEKTGKIEDGPVLNFVSWTKDSDGINLDGEFSAEQLEALACWMNHYKAKESEK